jgi:hypothetical protein
LHVVMLDALPATASISTLPSPQFGIDKVGIHSESSRKPSQDGNATRPMRFASGMKC